MIFTRAMMAPMPTNTRAKLKQGLLLLKNENSDGEKSI